MNMWTLMATAGIAAVWIIMPHVSHPFDAGIVRAVTVALVASPFMLVMVVVLLDTNGRRHHHGRLDALGPQA